MTVTGSLSLTLCGDVNLQRRDDPDEAFRLVADRLRRADVLFGNMEMCLYRDDALIPDKPGWVQSDVKMVAGLISAGFAGVGCANNVTYGREAVLSSLRELDAHGIGHCGSGVNEQAAREPLIVEKHGVRLGFLARTAVFFPYGHRATATEPGVATVQCHTAYEPNPRADELPAAPPIVRSWPSPAAQQELLQDVAAARSQVDILVCNFHWGVSGSDEVAEYQRHIGHAVIDAGADLVIGSHAHLPQPVEVYNNKVIFYGLGNFAFDWPPMTKYRKGILAEVQVAQSTIQKVIFSPVLRRTDELNQPEVLEFSDPRSSAIAGRVIELSQELGTHIAVTSGEAVVWHA
jgi:poly-gamma-glutamate synthesis protein (capsule biosynthesis protein)